MGAGVCCQQRRLEFTVDCFNENPVTVHSFGASATPVPSTCARSRSPGRQHDAKPGDSDYFAAEIARQIASDRQQQLYESASLIPVFYEVRLPEFDQPQNTVCAVHRKTGVTRQLASFRKPEGSVAQERLSSFVSSLQLLSAQSEEVAKVFEVFEDYMNVHLLLEHCTGGTVYERILARQYFTEQESAVLVRHMLQTIAPLHDCGLYHGSLTPDSFRFLNGSPHAPLKLVDFGVELKIHRWEAVERLSSGPDLQNPHCQQFFETCKLVFCAPEFAPPFRPRSRVSARRTTLALLSEAQDRQAGGACRTSGSMRRAPSMQDILDGELLADVIDEHADWFDEQREELTGRYHRKYEAADIWSVGAIAFLLLCGYPPFFAPSRNAILGRIHRTDFSFDPPFWSKISEDAKSFVSSCILESCWDRPSVREALEHPWIQRLADSSPAGSMFSSFMLNLRRFYRTSLIEMFVANMLATTFRRQDVHDFLRRCREIDACNSGFFTASDLKHVLTALGQTSIADAITARFLRAFRHPGESYIDYVALLDSIHLRQQRIFEEELWQHFQRVCQSSGRGGPPIVGCLSLAELGMLFSDPVIVGLLMREIPESAGVEEAAVCRKLQSSIQQHCSDNGTTQVEFRDLAALLRRAARTYTVANPQLPLASSADRGGDGGTYPRGAAGDPHGVSAAAQKGGGDAVSL